MSESLSLGSFTTAGVASAPMTKNAIRAGKDAVTFQASGTTTAGAGAATITIEASDDQVGWLVLGTITLVLGVAVATDGFAAEAPWTYFRATVATGGITGTGAVVNVSMGV